MAPYSQDPFSPLLFYRLIKKPNLDTIMIPSKFTGRYGRCLSNPLTLKSPDGKRWTVHWTTCDKEIWLLKGWKEFTSFYSIDEGHLVVFKYEGNSQIGVHIIDHSCLEIDYPWSMDDDAYNQEEIDNATGDTIVILDAMPPSPEGNLDNLSDDMQLSPSRPLKKIRNEDVRMESFIQLSKKKSDGDTGTRLLNKGKSLNSGHNMKKVLSTISKHKALKGARSFESDNPYFTTVMQPSYISTNSCLPVPKEFAVKHLNNECEHVKLQTLDGRSWTVYYKFPKLGRGWRQFVKESGLEVGDVCAFDMIDQFVFRVHVLTDAEKGNKLNGDCSEKKQKSRMQDPPLEEASPSFVDEDLHFEQSSSMEDQPLEKASSSHSKKPNFTVMMSVAHIHGPSYVNVPFELAKAHLSDNNKSVILSVEDKDWTVGYGFRSRQQSAEFSWGWKQFCKDNELNVGDVCQFELTKKFRFQVTIFRL